MGSKTGNRGLGIDLLTYERELRKVMEEEGMIKEVFRKRKLTS